nr:hypothetical protein GCM10020241_03630 [Streptoalloteichus tenebrarius]
MRTVVRLSSEDFSLAVSDLADLLVDVVTVGSSLGFLAPVPPGRADGSGRCPVSAARPLAEITGCGAGR